MTITVSVPELIGLGFWPDADILIEPERGRYVVTLFDAVDEKVSIEVPVEPAEPDLQKLAIKFATERPVDAVMHAAKAARGSES